MISLAISCNGRKDKSSECQSFFEANSSSLVTAPKADTFDNEVLREKMPLCKVEIWTIWRNTNFGGIFSLLLGLGSLAIRPQGCCWNYLKTFEFRKRLLSDYNTYNGCRNEFWPRERQMFKNTSNVFSASRAKGKKIKGVRN